MKTKIKSFRIAEIQVLGKHRPLVPEKVRALADSMKVIGLKTPPTVRISKKGPVLVTGQHRVAAAKKLGMSRIPCIVMRGDKNERQLWRIAENLHRNDLTKLQRAECINKWDKLIKERAKGVHVARPGGQQPHDKGFSKTAKQLGISREAVRRSKKIAGISPKAKKAAKKAGLDDNQAALLKAAKRSTQKGQTLTLQEFSKNKKASRGHSPSPREVKQLKALKKAYAAAYRFKKAWKRATEAVRKKFLTAVLKPST